MEGVLCHIVLLVHHVAHAFVLFVLGVYYEEYVVAGIGHLSEG